MVATDAAIRYRIDVAMSRFTVRAFATGLFSSLGHSPTLAIRDYTGEATFVSSNPEQSAIRISVKPASLTVTDDVSQKDRADIENRMNQDVLETSGHPEIVFESSSGGGERVRRRPLRRERDRKSRPARNHSPGEDFCAGFSYGRRAQGLRRIYACARATTVSSSSLLQAAR